MSRRTCTTTERNETLNYLIRCNVRPFFIPEDENSVSSSTSGVKEKPFSEALERVLPQHFPPFVSQSSSPEGSGPERGGGESGSYSKPGAVTGSLGGGDEDEGATLRESIPP